jgi:hypothetical protein
LRTDKIRYFSDTSLMRIAMLVTADTHGEYAMHVILHAPDGGRKKVPQVSKHELSARRIGLLELMQGINFGCIEDLVVLAGDPVLDPMPRVIREVKFGSENGPRAELDADNFLLKTQVVELFTHFDRLGDGTVEILEIKHGLPFRMLIAEAA